MYQPQPAPYKKQLRGSLRKVTLCLFGFYAILITTLIVIVFIYAIGQMASDSYSMTRLMRDTPTLAAVASLFGIVFGSLIMLAISGKHLFTTNLTRFKERAEPFDLFEVFVLMMGIQAVMSIIVLPFSVFGLSDTPLSMPTVDISDMMRSPWGLLYIVLVGPIAEEIIFRGAIMRSLQRYGDNFAIVISALLFGLYHMFFFQGMFAFFVGILFGYVALRFSIKWSMLLHILNNLLSSIEEFLPDWAMVIVFLIEALCFIGAILILTLDRRKLKAQLLSGKPVPVSVIECGYPAGFTPMPPNYGITPAPQAYYSNAPAPTPQPYGVVPTGQPYGAPAPIPQPYGYPPQQTYSYGGAPPQQPYGTPAPIPQPYGLAPQQPYNYADKAHPFKVAFSSASLIVTITILGIISIVTQVLF
jgi:membrane protease YdiL (CAAX protease family)